MIVKFRVKRERESWRNSNAFELSLPLLSFAEDTTRWAGDVFGCSTRVPHTKVWLEKSHQEFTSLYIDTNWYAKERQGNWPHLKKTPSEQIRIAKSSLNSKVVRRFTKESLSSMDRLLGGAFSIQLPSTVLLARRTHALAWERKPFLGMLYYKIDCRCFNFRGYGLVV